jgi:hypothetical protein
MGKSWPTTRQWDSSAPAATGNERLQTADDLQRHPFDHGHDRRLRESSEVPDRGIKPNPKKIKEYVERSLMLVTALSPVIGYDKASTLPALQDLAPVWRSFLAVASDVTHNTAIRGPGPAARPS